MIFICFGTTEHCSTMLLLHCSSDGGGHMATAIILGESHVKIYIHIFKSVNELLIVEPCTTVQYVYIWSVVHCFILCRA